MLIRLNSFRIKNFRCIVDTGWCNLSCDNITSIIGMNESGKTSILDALNSFYIGEISEDDLRADGSSPEVTCSFIVESFSDSEGNTEKTLPSGFKLQNGTRVNITRKWNSLDSYSDLLEEKSVHDKFTAQSNQIDTIIANTKAEIEAIKKVIAEKNIEYKPLLTTNPSKAAEVKKEIDELTEKITELQTKLTSVNTDKSKIFSEDEFIEYIWEDIPEFVMFRDESSILPGKIDLSDIEEKNEKAEGFQGAQNFLTIAGIDISALRTLSKRIIETKLEQYNASITTDFQAFWTQKIGKTNKVRFEVALEHHSADVKEKPGEPYLGFWIKNGQEKLYSKQRSKGVRWFLSFYLQLKASAINRDKENKKLLFLIDEPGGSLHANAQKDALKIFDDIRKHNIQILFTTHSPYLITVDTFYRILAVQRNEEDDASDTKVFDVNRLGSASLDTLSPLYTIMGVDLSHQGVITRNNNVIVEEISAHYYLQAFWKMLNVTKSATFIPATGVNKTIPLAYMFIGWNIEFIVVVDDEPSGRHVYNTLKRDICGDDDAIATTKLIKIKDCKGIEDIFTVTDFKALVLEDSKVKVDVPNSEFMKQAGYSKPVYALKFLQNVISQKIEYNKMTKTTQSNIKSLVDRIEAQLH